MKTLENTLENQAKIYALKKINKCRWSGNVVHSNLESCLTAINLDSNNSGWYIPTPIRINGLDGIYMINEDGSLFWEAKVIKESNNKFKIEWLISTDEFEKFYFEFLDNNK